MHAEISAAGGPERMARMTVEWNLLPCSRIPAGIRSSVERRLVALWRFLDRSRTDHHLIPAGSCRSEEFEMQVDHWQFTYEVDVVRGIALIRHAGCH
jgi:hypothetical protein